MNWFIKYFQSIPIITLDMELYNNKCIQSWLETSQYFKNKKIELQNFKLNSEFVQQVLAEIGYPNIENIIKNLNSEELINSYHQLYEWAKTKNLNSDQRSRFYEVTKQLRNQMDKNDDYIFDEETAKLNADKVIALTARYMNLIENKIKNAIKNLGNWYTKNLKIIPNVSFYGSKEDYTKPATSASVEFGDDDFAPSFTLFFDGQKIIIDDVLESGDTDFFTSSEIQNDYFRLIKELRNPGSSIKPSKNLTLYTARPSKDRQIYLNSTTIPSNIFLAKNYNTAEGYALEFRDRDIWKITIEEKYVIQTNDYPQEFQTIGNGSVPIKAIRLLNTDSAV